MYAYDCLCLYDMCLIQLRVTYLWNTASNVPRAHEEEIAIQPDGFYFVFHHSRDVFDPFRGWILHVRNADSVPDLQ